MAPGVPTRNVVVPTLLVTFFTMVAFISLSWLVLRLSNLETENRRLKQQFVDTAPSTTQTR